MSEVHSGLILLGNIDGNSNSYKCENMPNPTNAQDYVTKIYADALLVTPTLIAPVEILDAIGGNVIAKIDTDGNLFIKGRLLKIT